MPKRRNPFGEITPLQRKMHVGFEQMATEQERQEVYERTKALLFRGANPTSHRASGLTVPGPPREPVAEHSGLLRYFTPSQTGSGATQRRARVPGRGGARGGGRVRGECCGCRQLREVEVCEHCEKSVCGDCCRHCCQCQAVFCPYCSVLNYDEDIVRTLCLNCLPAHS